MMLGLARLGGLGAIQHAKPMAAPLWAPRIVLQARTRAFASDASDDAELQQIAMAEYGKAYNELGSHEKQHCAGKKGVLHKRAKQEHRQGEEYPHVAEQEEKHLYSKDGGASAKAEGGGPDVPRSKLQDIAEEKYSARWEDITPIERADVGRTAAVRESQAVEGTSTDSQKST